MKNKNEIKKKKDYSLIADIIELTLVFTAVGAILVLGDALESIKINGESISKLRKLSTESLQTRIKLAVSEERYTDAGAFNEILKAKP